MDSKQRNVIQEVRGNYFCYWNECSDSFVNVQQFYDHVKYHIADAFFHRSAPNVALCCKWSQCTKTYAKESHMEAHVVSHTNQKLIACSNCGIRFVNKYRLVDHLKRQMEGTVSHQCPQCNKCFPFEKQLRSHMKRHINCFKCDLCDMTCSSKGALVKHLRYRHISERPFQCMLCDFKAVIKRDLEVHESVHDPNFFLRCSVPACDFTCKSMQTFKRHEANHNGDTKLFKCHVCEKTFHFGARLSRHLITMHEFQYPSGFQRFHYKQDEDGFHRLQLTRLESLEVTEQIVGQDETVQSAPNAAENEPKPIEEFDMMKKYLRTTKSDIVLEVLEQDETGMNTRTATFFIQELVPDE